MATDSWQQHVLQQLPRMEASSTTFEPGPVNPQPISAGMHLQPQFDVIELLEANAPAAAERLKTLRERSSERRDAMIPHIEVQEAIAERTRAQQHLRRLQAHPQDGGFNLPPTDARVIEAERQVERTTENARRLTERSERLAAAWRAAAQPLSNTENLLRHGMPSGVLLQDHETEMPKLLKSEAVVDGIERLRRRCRELKADQHRIASAPYPSSYAKAQMRAQIEALAMQGAPSVSRLVELDGPVDFQTQRLRSEAFGAETPVGLWRGAGHHRAGRMVAS